MSDFEENFEKAMAAAAPRRSTKVGPGQERQITQAERAWARHLWRSPDDYPVRKVRGRQAWSVEIRGSKPEYSSKKEAQNAYGEYLESLRAVLRSESPYAKAGGG
jgi:hypothetical protein